LAKLIIGWVAKLIMDGLLNCQSKLLAKLINTHEEQMLADENFILTIIHKEQVVADEKFK
jgi:hypothetical protein